MNKTNIKSEYIKLTSDFVNYVQNLSSENRNKLIDGKWSVNQNLEHLILSVSPINFALQLPKFILKLKFGKISRPPKPFETLKEEYMSMLESGAKATKRFVPRQPKNIEEKLSIQKYQFENKKLLKNLEKWNDVQLDSFVLPHPIMGDLTIREMLNFTYFHTEHHFNSIKNI